MAESPRIPLRGNYQWLFLQVLQVMMITGLWMQVWQLDTMLRARTIRFAQIETRIDGLEAKIDLLMEQKKGG